MYCTSCGTKVQDGARFCPVCGNKLMGAINEAAESREDNGASLAAKGASAEPKIIEGGAGAHSTASASTAPSCAPTANAGRAAGRMSFSAFMMQRRQIGRVAVPTFAAILIAMALTAGIAYALVKAYEAFVLPQTQQQEQAVSTEKKSSKKEIAAKNKKAHKAYEGVIARYEDFASYCEQAGAGVANYDDWAKDRGDDSGVGEEFAYIAQNAYGTNNYYGYLLDDVNGDGIDELFIGMSSEDGSISEILGIYCFVDGKAVSVVEGSDLTESSGDMNFGQLEGFMVRGESQEYMPCKDGAIKFSCSQDANKSVLFFELGKKSSKLIDAAQMICQGSDRQNGAYVVRTIEDGGQPQETTVQGRDEAQKVIDEFAKKHPEADFEKPSASSDSWKKFKSVEPKEVASEDSGDEQGESSAGSGEDQTAEADATEDDASDGQDTEAGNTIPDMDAFIATAKRELRVPDDPSITYEVADEPSYWEGTATYVWYVAFYKDGKIVASADCGSSGYPSRSIMGYSVN